MHPTKGNVLGIKGPGDVRVRTGVPRSINHDCIARGRTRLGDVGVNGGEYVIIFVTNSRLPA